MTAGTGFRAESLVPLESGPKLLCGLGSTCVGGCALRSCSACSARRIGWFSVNAVPAEVEFSVVFAVAVTAVRTLGARLRPTTKSPLSLRQFLATPENCSRCHFTVTVDPSANGRLRRTHAPDLDVSSSVPGERQGAPLASCQETSARAHNATRGSTSCPSMPDVSAL